MSPKQLSSAVLRRLWLPRLVVFGSGFLPRRRRWLFAFCLTLLLTSGISLLSDNVLTVQVVPTRSMALTLDRNQLVMVNRLYRSPQRGDVVAFYLPESDVSATVADKTMYFSRVIGLPGDSVEATEEHIVVNQQPLLEEPYVLRMSETHWKTRQGWLGPSKTVPDGHYYLLGDNRDTGMSHYEFGFVPRENLVGQAIIISPSPLLTTKSP